MPSRKKTKQQSNSRRDPNASREAAKYASPIASREFIFTEMEAIGEPADLELLASRLEVSGKQQLEALRRRLNAMSREGQIISNRRGAYGLADRMDLVKGTVQGNKDGAGFFIPDNKEGDMFLPLREMSRLFDGDRVLARFTKVNSRGRREATVVEILERRYTQVVGRFYQDTFGVLVPENKRIQHEILIPPKQTGGAADGQYVLARMVQFPDRHRNAIAEVIEVLGDETTPGIEVDLALHSFAIPHNWPEAVKTETACLPDVVGSQELSARYDLRKIPFVTIDGEDAKDFDDAIFTRPGKGGGWTLMVAIADVSNYVAVDSALDAEARSRGTSVYFPGHVIPMLPERISNGLCSLKPRCDRLAIVCEIQFSKQGRLQQYQFLEAVIHSHARLTYTEVADMLQPSASGTAGKIRARLRKRHRNITANLDDSYSLYLALRKSRADRGAIDFDSTETRMVFGEDRKIREIIPVERNDAHRLIEECMLMANVAASGLLQKAKLPALYRIHAGPDPKRLEGLREFLSEIGLSLGGGAEPEPADYQATLHEIGDRPDRHLLQTMLIKSMQQAVYQPENTGHFGLGFENYTHFTSPIRRFPDLLVHRAIRYLIRNTDLRGVKSHPQQSAAARKKLYPYSTAELNILGNSCSAQERRADAAAYSVIDWLKCEFMQDRVGEEFTGTISSVTSFGLFVELEGIYIEGLVHITELSNDYYHFDPVRHSLEGEHSRRVYRLGDSVTVRLASVDLAEKKIDLQMVGSKVIQTRNRKTARQTEDRRQARNKKVSGKKKPDSQAKNKSKARGKTRFGAVRKNRKK